MKTHESLIGHPSDELLELYWFRRLNDFRLDELEEHLLICPACQDRMAETDSYVQAMKYACRHAARSPALPAGPRSFKFPSIPKAALFSLCAIAIIAVTLPLWNPNHRTTAAQTALSLVAARGAGVVSGRAGVPLRLNLDLTGLPPLPSYRVQVVRGSGKIVWESEADFQSGLLSVSIPQPLDADLYWVRVSQPNAGPVREFGLQLK